MTRTLITLDEAHINELDRLAVRERRSRAALVRQAVTEFLQKRSTHGGDAAFGLWEDDPVDGLAYQEKLRGEW